MLSVKQVYYDREDIFLAHEARFTMASPAVRDMAHWPPEARHGGGAVNIIRENGEPLDLTVGTVYVMNDRGKTISTYHLGDVS
jgi:hypothetical protein